MSQKPITLGHVEAHEKLTARVFVQPTGEVGYVDVGNVLDYKEASERQFRTRMRVDNGVRVVSDEEVDTIHDKWEFTLDEHDEYNERLIRLSGAGTTTTSAAVTAPAGTASFVGVTLGRSYFLGREAVNTVVCKKGVTSLVEGTDYTVDLNTGRITLLTSATGIDDGDTLDVTYGASVRVNAAYTAQAQGRFEGAIRIEEKNQHSKEPLRIITFSGVIMVTAFPENTGEFSKYTVRVTPLEAPSVKKRQSAP